MRRSLLTTIVCLLAASATAEPLKTPTLDGGAEFVSSGMWLTQPEAFAAGEEPAALFDEQVEPTQFGLGFALSRSAQIATQSQLNTPRRRRASAAQTAGSIGLASIPFMIGDTGAGTCLAFSGIIEWEVSHPTLSCSRLNVAENNSAIPVDRGYFSYRHFHNAVNVRLFQFVDELDIDRFTLGFEKTFAGGSASIEMRMPLSARLRSDFVSAIVVNTPGPDGTADLVVPIGSGDETQLEAGNLSVILKKVLVERERLILSGGLGVTIPTAQDVETGLALVGFPEVSFLNVPGILAQSSGSTFYDFENETVYLSPFLAWAYAGERSKWFHQGFLQIEVAANRSSFSGSGGYDNIFTDLAQTPIGVATYEIAPDFVGELQSQTLMRLNLGVGRVLVDRPRAAWLQRLTGLAELHYTTTLQDATLTDIPIVDTLNIGVTLPLELTVGNQANRVDILNAALGLTANVGSWTINNGAVAPLRTGQDRGFDFEYNLQLQRVF